MPCGRQVIYTFVPTILSPLSPLQNHHARLKVTTHIFIKTLMSHTRISPLSACIIFSIAITIHAQIEADSQPYQPNGHPHGHCCPHFCISSRFPRSFIALPKRYCKDSTTARLLWITDMVISYLIWVRNFLLASTTLVRIQSGLVRIGWKRIEKEKRKKKSRIHIFSCFEHGSGTGTLHRMYAHHIPPAHDIVFFPLTSIPSHPSPPVMEISKGGRWGFGLFYLPLTTYDDF